MSEQDDKIAHRSGISVLITGNQSISGIKVFTDAIVPSGDIVATEENNTLVVKDSLATQVSPIPGSLTIAFQEGVYVTGSDLHVQGAIHADEIVSTESVIAGESGAMVLTDGRDPALFEGPDSSLSMAFNSGVYITGGSNLYVEGKIFADEIEAVDTIVGESGALVLTDGRDPALFEGPDESLSLAFRSGVYLTGGSNLYVEGKIFADEIEAVETIVGESGAMVLTDGRDPALFEHGDESLSLAFRSGVYITGGAKLHINEDIIVSGKSFTEWINTSINQKISNTSFQNNNNNNNRGSNGGTQAPAYNFSGGINEIGNLASGIFKIDFDENKQFANPSYISGWLRNNMGELNVLIHTTYGGPNPGLGDEEQSIYRNLFLRDYYKKLGRQALLGVTYVSTSSSNEMVTSDWTELRDGDSVIRRKAMMASPSEKITTSRQYSQLSKEADEELQKLLYKYNIDKSGPRQVAGKDAPA